MRQAKLGVLNPNYGKHSPNENHPNWRGDKISIGCLHKWIRRHLPKPELCQMCYQVPPYDLANITNIYNRNFDNWRYLCRSCHMISDGRMDKIHEPGIKRSRLVKKMWSTMSKEERSARIKKGWIKRKK